MLFSHITYKRKQEVKKEEKENRRWANTTTLGWRCQHFPKPGHIDLLWGRGNEIGDEDGEEEEFKFDDDRMNYNPKRYCLGRVENGENLYLKFFGDYELAIQVSGYFLSLCIRIRNVFTFLFTVILIGCSFYSHTGASGIRLLYKVRIRLYITLLWQEYGVEHKEIWRVWSVWDIRR